METRRCDYSSRYLEFLDLSMASEAEVKSLKKQLIAVESRASDRASLAGASAERKVCALLEEQQAEFARKEVALQKTIRELQRGIESEKGLTALAQQKQNHGEARAAAAEARLSSVGDKTQRLEAAEAFAKRDVAEARRARDEQRTQVVLLQQQLAVAEAERAKAEERATQARKAAHSKSREAQDLRRQVAKWDHLGERSLIRAAAAQGGCRRGKFATPGADGACRWWRAGRSGLSRGVGK